VSETRVLTAKHCITNDTQISFEIDNSIVTRLKTKPRNILKNWTSDLAIIKLRQRIPDGFFPVKIHSDEFKPMPGTLITIVGFGKTDANTDPDGLLRYKSLPTTGHSRSIGLDSKTGGSCMGDSGGPAFVEIEGSNYLVGISSYIEVYLVGVLWTDSPPAG
jgi:secreted trypsin-like serine protease